MRKQWACLAPLLTGVILATQPSQAFSSSDQNPISFGGESPGTAIAFSSLLGFLTAFATYAFSSSSRRAKRDKRKFLSILFTDFWFEGFVTPGLGTILLFALCSAFWGWTYFWIWTTTKDGYINIAVPFLALLVGVVVYAIVRAMIESLVSITKTAESANAILNYLNRDNIEEEFQSEADLPLASLDDQRVEMFIDGKPISNNEEA